MHIFIQWLCFLSILISSPKLNHVYSATVSPATSLSTHNGELWHGSGFSLPVRTAPSTIRSAAPCLQYKHWIRTPTHLLLHVPMNSVYSRPRNSFLIISAVRLKSRYSTSRRFQNAAFLFYLTVIIKKIIGICDLIFFAV